MTTSRTGTADGPYPDRGRVGDVYSGGVVVQGHARARLQPRRDVGLGARLGKVPLVDGTAVAKVDVVFDIVHD
jgi:hypothetical protein